MRVGLVCPYSFDVHGGVQNHVLELATALTALGHEVAVLAPGEQTAELPAYVTTTGRAVPMPYNGSVARVSFGPLVAARVHRWLEGGDFHVVHIHEPATPSVSVLALWATRAPVVATFHTAQDRSWALETSAATFLKAGLGKIAEHIAVSDEAGRTMRRYLDVSPTVIPNGVDTLRFGVDRPVTGRPPHLVFIGRLDEARKGLRVLLDALPAFLRHHPDARLSLVGHGSRRAVTRAIDPRFADRVAVLGPLDDEAKASLLARADLVVAPNTHGESFGIVLVEAMSAGAAVVASDLPAFRQLLDDGRYGELCRVGDAGHLAEVLARVAGDDRGRAAMTARARKAGTAYDWSRIAPRVLEVYDAAVGPASRAAAG